MESTEIRVDTSQTQVADLTDQLAEWVQGRGDGLCHLFAPHATAGLALMELGSGSDEDLVELLARLMPRDERYTHQHGSRGHGADHLLPVLVSPSLVLAVLRGNLTLGTWQRVVLVDTNGDNPSRRVRLSFLSG